MNKVYLPSDFEKSEIEHLLVYKLNTTRKFKNSLNYILEKMPNNSLIDDLGQLPWEQGKNYKWGVVVDGDLKMLIRAYRTHFTFFIKLRTKKNNDNFFHYYDEEFLDYYRTQYGCFTYFSNLENLENSDDYYEDNFLDLNNSIKQIVEMLKDGQIHSFWNSVSLPRPKHVEIKNVWNGGETITTIDNFIFALEELDEKHLELFAKNEIIEELKKWQIGDKLGNFSVLRIATTVKNDYYHAVGLEIDRGEGKTEFVDVFSLVRWHKKDFLKLKTDFDGLLLLSEDSE